MEDSVGLRSGIDQHVEDDETFILLAYCTMK